MTAYSEPVHPARGQAVWVEDTGDLAGTLAFCNLVAVQDGKPSRLHSTPQTYLALSRAEADEWAAEHAAQHRREDALEAAVRKMPPYAHRPPSRGRPRLVA